jgi:hypothetical protein
MQIEHNEIRLFVVETAERLEAIGGFGHLEAGDTQRVSKHSTQIVVVLHDENPLRHDKL